ncbi:Lipoprotein signal peptidase, partial [Frankliniella fusca]
MQNFHPTTIVLVYIQTSAESNPQSHSAQRMLLTRQRQHLQVPHAAEMLKAEVPHLRAPAQEEGAEGQHSGDVADADVRDVDAPVGARKDARTVTLMLTVRDRTLPSDSEDRYHTSVLVALMERYHDQHRAPLAEDSYLSSVSSSSWLRSQAMHSSAASVTRGHHDRSRQRSMWRFSAIISTPSSVTLLQPDRLSTVRLGSECTADQTRGTQHESLPCRRNGEGKDQFCPKKVSIFVPILNRRENLYLIKGWRENMENFCGSKPPEGGCGSRQAQGFYPLWQPTASVFHGNRRFADCDPIAQFDRFDPRTTIGLPLEVRAVSRALDFLIPVSEALPQRGTRDSNPQPRVPTRSQNRKRPNAQSHRANG